MMRHHDGSDSIRHERGKELSFALRQYLHWYSRQVAAWWEHTKEDVIHSHVELILYTAAMFVLNIKTLRPLKAPF